MNGKVVFVGIVAFMAGALGWYGIFEEGIIVNGYNCGNCYGISELHAQNGLAGGSVPILATYALLVVGVVLIIAGMLMRRHLEAS